MVAGVNWHPMDQLQWEIDCVGWHGEVLQGKFAHYCTEWGFLPIDETCMEFSVCGCQYPDWDETEAASHREALSQEREAIPHPPETLIPQIQLDCPCEDEVKKRRKSGRRIRSQKSRI